MPTTPTTDGSAASGGWVQPFIDLGLPGDPSVSRADDPELSAPGFGHHEVRRLTGVTARQLDHWATAGVVSPSISNAAGSGTRRIYSFRDILALRVVKRLTDAGVSFRNVSRAVQTLRELGEADLASVVLVSDGDTVYQCRSDDEVIDLVRGGQGVFVIAVSHALAGLRSALAEPATVADLSARRRRRAARGVGKARATTGTTAEGTTAEGTTAEGTTAEGTTAEGTTAEGTTAITAARTATARTATARTATTPASTDTGGTGTGTG